MEGPKIIRDPVHKDITASPEETAIIDTPQMQRLRRIKQLSFCSLVYPGANHTRFEHSLGTMHLAGKMAEQVGIEETPARVAALIHDAGHLPFSHSLENLFSCNHEDNLKLLLNGELGDAIKDSGFSLNEIDSFLSGKGKGAIISSSIDADRMDYLLRDALYTGVAYGIIDTDRIISAMRLDNAGIAFEKKGVIALEALLVGRRQMHSAVYFHHTVKIADAMLIEAISELKGQIELNELLLMGDFELKNLACSQSKKAKELFASLDERRLWKDTPRGVSLREAPENKLLPVPIISEGKLVDLKEVSGLALALEE